MSKILFNILGHFSRTQALKFYAMGDFPSAETNFSKAIGWFEKSKNFKYGFDCQINLGNIYKASLLMDVATDVFQGALASARASNDNSSIAIALINLGMMAVLNEDFDKSEALYQEALDVSENVPHVKIQVLQAFGIMEEQRQNYEQAVIYLNQAIDICDEIDLISPQSVIYLDLGDIYVAMGDIEEATKAWNKAIIVYTHEANNAGIADTLFRLGQLNQNAGQVNSALEINVQLGRKLEVGNCYTILGLMDMASSNYENAEKMLHKALDIDLEIAIGSAIIRDYANLALLYKNVDNEEEYLKYYNQAWDIANQTEDEVMKQELAASFSFDSDGE